MSEPAARAQVGLGLHAEFPAELSEVGTDVLGMKTTATREGDECLPQGSGFPAGDSQGRFRTRESR